MKEEYINDEGRILTNILIGATITLGRDKDRQNQFIKGVLMR